MNSSLRRNFLVLATSAILFCAVCGPTQAGAANLRFQRPGAASGQSPQVSKNFRRPGVHEEAAAPMRERQAPVTKAARQRTAPSEKAPVVSQSAKTTSEPKVASVQRVARRDANVTPARLTRVEQPPRRQSDFNLASHGCEVCGDSPCACDQGPYLCDGPSCDCEVGCGCPEPSCGLYEPGCGIGEPSCGCGEPSCGICEPGCGFAEAGCGLAEPTCGCGEVGCGSCVALPGPDYFCFPVCLPRFKDLSVWGGVQGFRGPRDFANGRSDSNFGFHQGINVSGRAPLVGLLFPQLSYQLGYQGVQSRLHGTATSTDDRSQQFVTAGFFRRVNTGLQFGAVWDLMRDDLDNDVDLHQMRYELSIKSPQGREIGFWGTNSTNDGLSGGTLYEAVDQYALFIRWAFGNGYESRLWGGATGDGEGIFGGDFYAPLSNRWSVVSGFNYLITDEADGLAGVSEESWNIGISMVWHLGKTAKKGCRSPYRPLFGVADNGWMFVDRVR